MPDAIYITRSKINDIVPHPISPQEFEKVVNEDKSLVWAEESSLVSEEMRSVIMPKSSAIWTNEETGEPVWFVLDADGTMTFGYRGGDVDLTLNKIKEVATKLNAYVLQDDSTILLDIE